MSAHERTGWRDRELSGRHRAWGTNCPAVDLDFLMVEYNAGLPVALVEYKHHNARPVDLRHATYRALTALANAANLPFLLAYYWRETWAFYVRPVNARAYAIYHGSTWCFSERQFVATLYHMRRLKLEDTIYATLNGTPPPEGVELPMVLEDRPEAGA